MENYSNTKPRERRFSLSVLHIGLWIAINRGEQIFGCVLAVYGVAVPGGAILRPDAEGAFHLYDHSFPLRSKAPKGMKPKYL